MATIGRCLVLLSIQSSEIQSGQGIVCMVLLCLHHIQLSSALVKFLGTSF